MTAPLLLDKTHQPTEEELNAVLGRMRKHWDAIVTAGLDAESTARPEWKFYNAKSGWVFLLRGKKRNVLYAKPIEKGRFIVSFTFNEKAVAMAEDSTLPEDVIHSIRGARKYVEGRMASTEVSKAADAKVALELLRIKMASS